MLNLHTHDIQILLPIIFGKPMNMLSIKYTGEKAILCVKTFSPPKNQHDSKVWMIRFEELL